MREIDRASDMADPVEVGGVVWVFGQGGEAGSLLYCSPVWFSG